MRLYSSAGGMGTKSVFLRYKFPDNFLNKELWEEYNLTAGLRTRLFLLLLWGIFVLSTLKKACKVQSTKCHYWDAKLQKTGESKDDLKVVFDF